MSAPAFLLASNLLFIKVSHRNVFIKNSPPKYMASGLYDLFSDELYTEEEIRANYPDIKSGKSLLEIGDTWKSKL